MRDQINQGMTLALSLSFGLSIGMSPGLAQSQSEWQTDPSAPQMTSMPSPQMLQPMPRQMPMQRLMPAQRPMPPTPHPIAALRQLMINSMQKQQAGMTQQQMPAGTASNVTPTEDAAKLEQELRSELKQQTEKSAPPGSFLQKKATVKSAAPPAKTSIRQDDQTLSPTSVKKPVTTAAGPASKPIAAAAKSTRAASKPTSAATKPVAHPSAPAADATASGGAAQNGVSNWQEQQQQQQLAPNSQAQSNWQLPAANAPPAQGLTSSGWQTNGAPQTVQTTGGAQPVSPMTQSGWQTNGAPQAQPISQPLGQSDWNTVGKQPNESDSGGKHHTKHSKQAQPIGGLSQSGWQQTSAPISTGMNQSGWQQAPSQPQPNGMVQSGWQQSSPQPVINGTVQSGWQQSSPQPVFNGMAQSNWQQAQPVSGGTGQSGWQLSQPIQQAAIRQSPAWQPGNLTRTLGQTMQQQSPVNGAALAGNADGLSPLGMSMANNIANGTANSATGSTGLGGLLNGSPGTGASGILNLLMNVMPHGGTGLGGGFTGGFPAPGQGYAH